MNKITVMCLLVVLSLSFSAGCQSQYEKDAAAERERLKKKIGDVDKDLEKYQKALQNQEKPTKPMWDR